MIVRSASRPRARPSNLSSPIDAKMSEERIVVGSVARRPSSEVVREMAALAEVEKARMTAPAPPTPQFPGRFEYSQRRPRPLHRPIHPAPPVFRVAAFRTRDHEEQEKHLLEAAEELARRPRTPTPPRQPDDYYDLARWSVRRWK